MSDEVTPMYPTLFSQVQDYVVERLNSDYQLSAVGLEFIPEHIRDVEYLIKRNLGKQGMVGIVNTVKAQYGGHDGETQAWQMEVECDILENPPIRQAWMKKNDISAGTVVDCCNFVNESLAGPYSPTYGQFCSKSVEVGEDSGIVVGKCLFDTYALGEISGAISGESHYEIRWATKDELSALSAETWAAIDELSAELSGSEEVWNAIEELSGDIDNLEYNFEWAKEQIQEVIPQELSTKISYPVMEDNPSGGKEWILDPSPLDPSTPSTARVKFGAYEESVPGLYTPYIKLGDNPYLTIDQNHIWLGRTKLVNFPDMSAAISALDIDHFIRWFATQSQPNRWIINFGRSSTGGISFVSDSDHPTQSYIDIAGNIITAPGYDPNFQSRGLMKSSSELMKSRAGEEDDHLQYNQRGLAFVEEVSSVSQDVSDIQQDVSGISQDIQDLSSEVISAYEEIPSIWRVWEYDPGLPGLTFTAEEANSTVAMQAVGSAPSVSLEYSTDGSTWNDFIVGETTVTLANVGDKMAVRAKTTNSSFSGNDTTNTNYNTFAITGKIAASGSIMYLLKKNGDLDTIPSDRCFVRLFYGCQSLTTPPDLPATTLTLRCYRNMFNSSGITSMPNLPADTVPNSAYDGMFFGTPITTATITGMVSAGEGCCWSMFKDCTSLQSVEMPNVTTLSRNCFNTMFQNDSSLSSIKIGYTRNFSTTNFNNWVSGVAASGTFYYNGSSTARGTSAIPTGWTIQSF